MEQRLNALWYAEPGNGGFVFTLFEWLVLRPLGGLYALLLRFRGSPDKPAGLAAPVVVVGNLTIGGTGKTPLLIALCQRLMERGLRVGIVSRGYGRQASGLLEVRSEGEASDYGDEPLLIAQQLQQWAAHHQLDHQWRMMVCARRRLAVESLLDDFAPDIILADDGLQHRGLPRDIELIVIDGSRGFGNLRLLPAGPLREPLDRLQAADALVINGQVSKRLASQLPGGSPPTFRLDLEWQKLQPVNDLARQVLLDMAEAPVGRQMLELALVRQHWTIVAGIANPQRFFTAVREQIDAQALRIHTEFAAFADHHDFRREDFSVFQQQPTAVIMTAKDAIKCRTFANELAVPCFTIATDGAVDEALITMLVERCQREHRADTST